MHWALCFKPSVNTEGEMHEDEEERTMVSSATASKPAKIFFFNSGFSGQHSWQCTAPLKASARSDAGLIRAWISSTVWPLSRSVQMVRMVEEEEGRRGGGGEG